MTKFYKSDLSYIAKTASEMQTELVTYALAGCKEDGWQDGLMLYLKIVNLQKAIDQAMKHTKEFSEKQKQRKNISNSDH